MLRCLRAPSFARSHHILRSMSSSAAAADAQVFAPLPPFTEESAREKVRKAEDAWNSRDPERVSQAYTPDTRWRNRHEFIHGREQVKEFLQRKWAKEMNYRLIKDLWSFSGNRVTARFCYEYQDRQSAQHFRAYGVECWLFDEKTGQMKERHASINDVPIRESERKFHWAEGSARPRDHPGLPELGL